MLKEVLRYLVFIKAKSQGICVAEFEVDKDLAVDVLLAASYFQIE